MTNKKLPSKKIIKEELIKDLELKDIKSKIKYLAQVIGLQKLIEFSEILGGEEIYIPTKKGLLINPTKRLVATLVPKYKTTEIVEILGVSNRLVEKTRELSKKEKLEKIANKTPRKLTPKKVDEILIADLRDSDMSENFMDIIEIIGFEKAIECCEKIGGLCMYMPHINKVLYGPRKRMAAKLYNEKHHPVEVGKLLNMNHEDVKKVAKLYSLEKEEKE